MHVAKSAWRLGEIRRIAWKCLLPVAGLWLIAAPAATAQQEEEQKGVDQGNYNIKQSIEFGGRFTSIGGDSQAYDTFVNLQQGPRLLGFTTEMNSLDHHGTFFDRLYFNNFGYGGDPNNVSRLRVSKNKLYSLDALFRKDENFWDYSLQANPLNPTTSFANGSAGFGPPTCTGCVQTASPHAFNTRRKMGDYNLVVLPDSKVRFRAGYSRNIVQGPVFTSIHQGTEQFLLEDYKTTVNSYRLGVDFKILPRTNISYDEILTYSKGDTGTTDFAQPFALSPTQNVDLGVSFNAGANQPCGGTFLVTGFVNPKCSAYFSYLNHGRTRTNTPTEQLSLQSNYWKSWDLSARVSYSGGDSNVFGYNEAFAGLEARTNLRNDSVGGPVHNRRVAANADFGVTWRITDKLSFLDSFHYLNWHDPGEYDASDCSFFSASLLTSPNAFSPTAATPSACATPPGIAAGTPIHSTSSLADISVVVNSNFLKQDEKTNLAELEYQFSPRFGARLGYRYRHRAIDDNFFATTNEIFFPNNAARGDCALVDATLPLNQANLPSGCTLNGDGSILFVTPGPTTSPSETLINEHAALIGLWARPIPNWRISFDAELIGADNTFTRISPRESQEYRVRSRYKVRDWLSLNGSVRIWEGRNNVFEVNDLQHDRSYGVSALLQPTETFAMELGYDYDGVFSQVLICYLSSVTINKQSIPGPGIGVCPDVVGLVQQLSTYTNKSNYGYFDFTYSPFRRLTARLGANLTGNSGGELRLDPQALIPSAVSGPLNSKWLHPFGGFDYRFAKGWTGKAYWDYYGYHEDPTMGAVQDIFAPRNFRANLVTLSLRYAF
jgi:hypothetical protein